MDKLNRRKFIKNLSMSSVCILFSGLTLSSFSCDDDWISSLEYLPIQKNNPAIAHWEDECEECGECIEACEEKQKVYGTYKASESKHVCIHCGTCIKKCEEGAMTEKYNWQEVLKAIDDNSKIVIASTSPSVRVAIGDYFNMPSGLFLEENMVGACRTLGFDYVVDTNFSADLTIMEEANELQNRVINKTDLPQFTSCCPAWVKYVEIYYPELLKHISSVKSPISMQGAMVKSYFAQKKGIDPNSIVHVVITPCSAKKYEITRNELSNDGLKNNDFAITTNELSIMLKKRNINLQNQSGSFDYLMGEASGGGIIFGNTGGVMRAALRTAYYNVMGTNPPNNMLELTEIQGLNGLKEATINIGSITLNVAVCYEMQNAQILLEEVKKGNCKYDFIEVMACKGGCVGGAGQSGNSKNVEDRMLALNNADANAKTRYCHENTEIIALYKDFIGDVGGSLSKQYLHTSYNDKSDLL